MEKNIEKIVQEYNGLNKSKYSRNSVWLNIIWALVYILVLVGIIVLYCNCKCCVLQWQDVLLVTVVVCSVTILASLTMVNTRKSIERENKFNESMQRNIVNAYGKLLDHEAEILTKKHTEVISNKALEENQNGVKKLLNNEKHYFISFV